MGGGWQELFIKKIPSPMVIFPDHCEIIGPTVYEILVDIHSDRQIRYYLSIYISYININ